MNEMCKICNKYDDFIGCKANQSYTREEGLHECSEFNDGFGDMEEME